MVLLEVQTALMLGLGKTEVDDHLADQLLDTARILTEPCNQRCSFLVTVAFQRDRSELLGGAVLAGHREVDESISLPIGVLVGLSGGVAGGEVESHFESPYRKERKRAGLAPLLVRRTTFSKQSDAGKAQKGLAFDFPKTAWGTPAFKGYNPF